MHAWMGMLTHISKGAVHPQVQVQVQVDAHMRRSAVVHALLQLARVAQCRQSAAGAMTAHTCYKGLCLRSLPQHSKALTHELAVHAQQAAGAHARGVDAPEERVRAAQHAAASQTGGEGASDGWSQQ